MKLRKPKRSEVLVAVALIGVAGAGGYLFGFTPASLGDAALAVASDLFAPARNFRNHRIQRAALRAELERMATYQTEHLERSGDFAALDAIPDVADGMGFVITWRRAVSGTSGREPRWVAEAHWEDGPRGDVCAVALNLEPAYAGGIPLKQAGQVRCTWDLATRMNRGCLVCGAEFDRPEVDPDALNPRLQDDPVIEWVQYRSPGSFGPPLRDTLASEPRLTVVNRQHRLVLTAETYELVMSRYSNVHVLATGYYSDDAFDYNRNSFNEHQAMFAVVGDFNGDGLADVVGDFATGGDITRISLLSSPSGYGFAEMSSRRSERGELTGGQGTRYLRYAPPGTYPVPDRPEGVGTTEDGFMDVVHGGVSTLYSYSDGSWVVTPLAR